MISAEAALLSGGINWFELFHWLFGAIAGVAGLAAIWTIWTICRELK